MKLTLDQIADQLGTSKTNLTRDLTIERNLTEPMKQLLDDGVISKTVASDLIASLSKEKQEELISSMENVLRNWKDYMGLEMVLQMKKVIIELVGRIIRLTKNLNPILQHKWVSQLTLFRITKCFLK